MCLHSFKGVYTSQREGTFLLLLKTTCKNCVGPYLYCRCHRENVIGGIETGSRLSDFIIDGCVSGYTIVRIMRKFNSEDNLPWFMYSQS